MKCVTCEVPIFSVKWIDEDEFIACGGGEGNEIPNHILIMGRKLNLLLKHETGNETLLRMDYCTKTQVIIGTAMRKLVLFKFESVEDEETKDVEYSIKRYFEMDLKANEYPDADPKICVFNSEGTCFAVCDDDYNIYVYELDKESGKPKEKFISLKGKHKDVLSVITFSDDGKFLISGDKSNKCCVWNISKSQCLLEYTPEHFEFLRSKHKESMKNVKRRRKKLFPKFRVLFAKYDHDEKLLQLIHSSSSGPTIHSITEFPLSSKRKKENIVNICREGTTCVSKLRGERYVSLGCASEMLFVYDIETQKLLKSDQCIGGMSITSCDVWPRNPELELFEGISSSFLGKMFATKFKKKENRVLMVLKWIVWMVMLGCLLFFLSTYFHGRMIQ